MKLDTTTIVQIASFSTGIAAGLFSKYQGINFMPKEVEMFFYKYFSQSGRHLVEEDRRNDKRFSYDKKYSIHRGVSNDRAPS